MESDQDTELSIQVTLLQEDEPKTGDILLIGEEERLVIDIYNDDLILLDSDNKCSCESKSKRFEILENIGVNM